MKTNQSAMTGQKAPRFSSFRPWVLACAVALAFSTLAGCANQSVRPNAEAISANQMVDQQMNQAVQSVDQSLKLLVQLDRGDEGARKPGFIGQTIAGAKAPNATAPVMPKKAQPQTVLAQKQELARLNYNRLALKARMKAQWNGSASDLLKQVAQAIDFRYQESGAATLPKIHLNEPDTTVENVLSMTADQLKPAGFIKVLVGPRVICLVRSSSPEATCPAAFAQAH